MRYLISVTWASCLILVASMVQAQPQQGKGIYHRADSIAAAYAGHSLMDIPLLARKLTVPLASEKEKFRAIYTWVCHNIENDYYGYAINKKNRARFQNKPAELKAWNKKFVGQQMKELIRQHKTVCTGYAYLVRELSLHAGLDCVTVDGYARSAAANTTGADQVNHTWNAVQLEGNWHLCDATWGSGMVDEQKEEFIAAPTDIYFLTDPELFVSNHYPADTTWLLLKEKRSLQQFLTSPIVYRPIYTYALYDLSPASFVIQVKRGESIRLSFQTQTDLLDELALQFVGPGLSGVIRKPEVTHVNGVYAVIYPTTNLIGKSYVMHLMVNSEYAATYEVQIQQE